MSLFFWKIGSKILVPVVRSPVVLGLVALNVSVIASPNINLMMVLNNTSTESSLHVPSDGSLRPYWIEVQSSSIGYFSIEIIDVGSESSPTLSSGLPYFDAFTENPQTNCYQFKGDPTSSDPIRVSLMYS